jgi:hypothetical protein
LASTIYGLLPQATHTKQTMFMCEANFTIPIEDALKMAHENDPSICPASFVIAANLFTVVIKAQENIQKPKRKKLDQEADKTIKKSKV